MFDKQKYYKFINDVKSQIATLYSIYTIIFVILAYMIYQITGSMLLSILTVILGIGSISMLTKNLEIKLQEMYWRLEIYDKINKKAD